MRSLGIHLSLEESVSPIGPFKIYDTLFQSLQGFHVFIDAVLAFDTFVYLIFTFSMIRFSYSACVKTL
jgi:hypothetical protein